MTEIFHGWFKWIWMIASAVLVVLLLRFVGRLLDRIKASYRGSRPCLGSYGRSSAAATTKRKVGVTAPEHMLQERARGSRRQDLRAVLAPRGLPVSLRPLDAGWSYISPFRAGL